MDVLLKFRYCFIAGCCAAMGSFFAKLPSFLAEHRLCERLTAGEPTAGEPTAMEQSWACHICDLLLRVLPFTIMIFCNMLNWRYYLRALAAAEQSLTPTVLTAASNYILTFLLGACVYAESLTVQRAVGMTLIVAGLWCLSDAPPGSHSPAESVKRKTS